MPIVLGPGIAVGPGITIANIPAPVPLINLQSAPSSGTTWTDSSGNGYNATVAGGSTYTAANGGGLVLNGAYVDIPYNIASNTFSISMAIQPNPVTYWSTFWGNDSYNAGKGYLSYLTNATSLSSGTPSGAQLTIVSSISFLAIWDWVCNGTTMTVYKNGTQIGTGTFVAPVGGFATNNLFWGSRHANLGVGSTDVMPGTFYLFQYYNSSLTGEQVLNNFNTNRSRFGL